MIKDKKWKKCRKKPVVVEYRETEPGEFHVSTREGTTNIRPDDLIIRGVHGEEHPIGREIFNATYETNLSEIKSGVETRDRIFHVLDTCLSVFLDVAKEKKKGMSDLDGCFCDITSDGAVSIIEIVKKVLNAEFENGNK